MYSWSLWLVGYSTVQGCNWNLLTHLLPWCFLSRVFCWDEKKIIILHGSIYPCIMFNTINHIKTSNQFTLEGDTKRWFMVCVLDFLLQVSSRSRSSCIHTLCSKLKEDHMNLKVLESRVLIKREFWVEFQASMRKLVLDNISIDHHGYGAKTKASSQASRYFPKF